MSATTTENVSKAPDLREARIRYFEPQLIALSLGKEQIESQNLAELRRSLHDINKLIEHPSDLGIYKGSIKFSVLTSELSLEVGALPLLLERRKLIEERITLLEKQEEIVDLQNKAKHTVDKNEREEFEKQTAALLAEVDSLKTGRIRSEEQLKDAEKALQEALSDEKKQELEEKREKRKLDSLERRTRILQRFIERESVATIVGGILLIMVTIFLMFSANNNTDAFEKLSNAFLLILGFFFGQSVSRASSHENSNKGDLS